MCMFELSRIKAIMKPSSTRTKEEGALLSIERPRGKLEENTAALLVGASACGS